MANKNQMEYAYLDASYYKQECFEFGMEYEHAVMCCHPGSCDSDCEFVRNIPYIRKQLDKLTSEQMEAAARECGVGFEEYERRAVPREVLELYIVWLSAGEIVDEVCEREECE